MSKQNFTNVNRSLSIHSILKKKEKKIFLKKENVSNALNLFEKSIKS